MNKWLAFLLLCFSLPAFAVNFSDLKEGQRLIFLEDQENILFECKNGQSGKGFLIAGSTGTVIKLSTNKRISLKPDLVSSLLTGYNYHVSIQLHSNPNCIVTLKKREFLKNYKKNPDFQEIDFEQE